MSPEVVYRSSHPDVLAHWNRQPEFHMAWQKKVADALTELGFEMTSRFLVSGRDLAGVAWPSDAELPDGWRRDRKMSEAIVPDRRLSAGRKAAAVLDEVRQPDPRDDLPGGMPSEAFASMSRLFPGIAELGGFIVVTWSKNLDAGDAERIDPEVWERVPLSRYWAMREAAEAEGGAA